MQLRLPLLLWAVCTALQAHAILIRTDRDDEEYLELAARYTSSIHLGAADGEGVLIAPRWVLTAAHVARALKDTKPMPRFDLGGRAFEIESIYIHPDWKNGGPNDIALVLLAKPLAGIQPTPLYRGSDEEGKALVIVGHGQTGKIGEKTLSQERRDRKKRAAINTVDRVSARTLELRIKAGDDASDLQGAATPGDGGGPAYLQNGEGLFVAGIGYATDDTNADGIAGNVGDWETYARVSAFVPWIEATMLDVAKREADALMDPERR